jgi:hypothetical protein
LGHRRRDRAGLGRQGGMKKACCGGQQAFKVWWRFTDSNRGPVDYDSIALTD